MPRGPVEHHTYLQKSNGLEKKIKQRAIKLRRKSLNKKPNDEFMRWEFLGNGTNWRGAMDFFTFFIGLLGTEEYSAHFLEKEMLKGSLLPSFKI